MGLLYQHGSRCWGQWYGVFEIGFELFIERESVQVARSIDSSALAAFLDDRPDKPLRDRAIAEWDSSCCLIALRRWSEYSHTRRSLDLTIGDHSRGGRTGKRPWYTSGREKRHVW